MDKLGLTGQPQRDWQQRFAGKQVSQASQAIAPIRRGGRIFVASNCGVPQALVQGLVDGGEDLADCEIVHLLTQGAAPTADARFHDRFRHNAFFVGANVREAVNRCQADYSPVFLSELPELFRSGELALDTALITLSPPDAHGFCSLGIGVDVAKAAVESARLVVAQINRHMPRTHGDSFVHVDQLDQVLLRDEALPAFAPSASDAVSRAIGEQVARLVPDGATVQTGIGKIPDAVLQALAGKHDLGIHTEMFSDGVMELVEAGVITGRRKTLNPGKIVTSFCMGSRKLYDFVDDNPLCEFRPSEYVNDPFRISQHERMVAVNSAIEIDLTGQVCADSIGARFYSGIGGQVDFLRGAARSRDGRAVICLPSTALGGKHSRIVPFLQQGAGVVTSRGDVHFVATEYGMCDLHGRTIRERALGLIQIAHPDFRHELFVAAQQRGLLERDQPEPPPQEHLRALQQDIELGGGRGVRVRPARMTDERMLQEMWYGLSQHTLMQRYTSPRRTLSRDRARELLDFDGRERLMLVAVVQTHGGRQRMVGLGRYAADDSGMAELGILIHDDYQALGLGRVFLLALARQAVAAGLRGFCGQVPAGNKAALELFESYGQEVKKHVEGDICHLRFAFK